jgi:hypothetical protein
MSGRVLIVPAVACCLVLLAVAGCSKSADEVKATRAAHETSQQAPAQAAARARAIKSRATVPGDAELVSAVADANTPAGDAQQYDLRFRLLARPEVAQPLQIELVAVPAEETAFVRLQLDVQPGDGISINGQASFDDQDLPAGTRARHTITVVPAQAGVLQLYVNTMVVTDKTSIARHFAVPLIASGAQPAGSGK